jgi:hypothetical protein
MGPLRHHGGVIPASGLQGYVAEHQFTVTTLLIDRSLGNSKLRGNKLLLFASNPNSSSLDLLLASLNPLEDMDELELDVVILITIGLEHFDHRQ